MKRSRSVPADSRQLGQVHLIEMGGRGGVFQHTLAVASALVAAGVPVVVHTAEDREATPSIVPTCTCMRWCRSLPSGVRQPITAVRFLVTTLPHLHRRVRGADLAHVQGTFGYSLTWAMLRALRRAHVVFTPHNSFARSGKPRHLRLLRSMTRQADVVIALVEEDRHVFEGWGVTVSVQPLILDFPRPSAEGITRWRERFGGSPTALLAGQVRRDKQPDIFVAACVQAGVIPVVVGPEADGEGLLQEAGDRLNVSIKRFAGYLPLEDFVAAIAAVDVVVASHEIGSGSGPLAIAAELGCRTATLDVGGFGTHATAVADQPTIAGLSQAIRRALSGVPSAVPLSDGAGEQILRAYALSGWQS
jgi:hypothetical protein